MRRLLSISIHRRSTPRPIPNIPFIKRKPKFLRRLQTPTQQNRKPKPLRQFAAPYSSSTPKISSCRSSFRAFIRKVAMQRNGIHIRIALLEHRAIPFQICAHPWTARSASHQRKIPIHISHLPACVRRLQSVLHPGHMPDLPRPVHLVSQAPMLHRDAGSAIPCFLRRSLQRVQHWCLGNEMDGPWQIGHMPGVEYATEGGRTQAGKCDMCRNLTLVACGSSGPGMSTYLEWDRAVLEQCYPYVDAISLHRYFTNEGRGNWRRQLEIFGVELEYGAANCRVASVCRFCGVGV